MKEQLEQQIKQLKTNASFLLTVSGGVDSMVLLHLFSQLKCNFIVAHCNFQLRDKSFEDEQLVKHVCKEIGVKSFVKHFNTKEYSKANQLSTQMAARELRYTYFNDLLIKENLQYIVTAHHLNDQLETVLLNLTKGTGINGLTGMKMLTNNIFRPLLAVTKDEIVEYATLHEINYLDDASNQSNDYQRNKIRNEVVPVLKQINPSLESTFLDTLMNLEFANSNHEVKVKQLRHKLIHSTKGGYLIYLKQLYNLPFAEQAFYTCIKPFGFKKHQISTIFTQLKHARTGAHFKSDEYQLTKDRERLLISELKLNEATVFTIEKNSEKIQTDSFIFYQAKKEEANFSSNKSEIQVDVDLLTYPLVLRKWLPGDYFYPFGLGKKQKLKKFFSNEKFSLLDKESTYLLCSGNKIVWVVGHRMDGRFKVTNKTKSIIEFTIA